MLVQAAALGAIAAGSAFATWLVAAAVLGLGTAMVYPTLLAAVADVADPDWRGSAIGVYRLWRDLGFAVGRGGRRDRRGRGGHAGRDLGGRRAHRSFGSDRAGADARDPP